MMPRSYAGGSSLVHPARTMVPSGRANRLNWHKKKVVDLGAVFLQCVRHVHEDVKNRTAE
jgi:hypothetical protein